MGQYLREAQQCNSKIDLAISDLEYLKKGKSYVSISLSQNEDVLKDLILENMDNVNKDVDTVIEQLQSLKGKILDKAKEIDDRIEREKQKEKEKEKEKNN